MNLYLLVNDIAIIYLFYHVEIKGFIGGYIKWRKLSCLANEIWIITIFELTKL